MGYGLSSPSNDLSLADIAELCDVFYIGGTKCGALFGEAVVISNDSLKEPCWQRAGFWGFNLMYCLRTAFTLESVQKR